MSEKCLFVERFKGAAGTLHESNDTIGGAEFCQVTACKGIYDIANQRVHGECSRPDELKQVLNDEAATKLFRTEAERVPIAEPAIELTEPLPLFTGTSDGHIVMQPSLLYDDGLGLRSMRAVDPKHKGFRR